LQALSNETLVVGTHGSLPLLDVSGVREVPESEQRPQSGNR
jgi:hypothetical protein